MTSSTDHLTQFTGFCYMMTNDIKTLEAPNPKLKHINYPYLKSYWVGCDWNILLFEHGIINHSITGSSNTPKFHLACHLS